jgi:hypothetical protein
MSPCRRRQLRLPPIYERHSDGPSLTVKSTRRNRSGGLGPDILRTGKSESAVLSEYRHVFKTRDASPEARRMHLRSFVTPPLLTANLESGDSYGDSTLRPSFFPCPVSTLIYRRCFVAADRHPTPDIASKRSYNVVSSFLKTSSWSEARESRSSFIIPELSRPRR